jgi:phosphoglycolate phosphatase-like HAD superfamily hydrolase
VADFNKGLSYGKRRRFRFMCLGDNTATLTAYANDVSYDDVYVEQLRNFLEPGDLVIGISGSGNSRNVVKAVEFANSSGAVTLGLTGYDGGALRKTAQHGVHIPIADMQVTEDLHMVLDHLAYSILGKILPADEPGTGGHMAERDYAPAADMVGPTSFIEGTGIEIIRPARPARPPEHALFDFDGTLSLVREGWMDIMVPMMCGILGEYRRPGETAGDLETLVKEFVTRLTGKQTIYQMIHLADEILARGGKPQDPQAFKEQFNALLMERIADRRSGLADGSASPRDFLVPGSIEMLEALRARGVAIYIASGTDEEYVLEEAALLGLSDFAPGRIHGAQRDHAAFSKEMVIRRILETNKVDGNRLLAFGDGYVEIADCKAVGGFAVGVASDEAGRSGKPDAWKRRRLIGAGADVVIPDFSDAGAVLDYIWSAGNEARRR